MSVRIDTRTVEDIVRFAVRDPSLNGCQDTLAAIGLKFEGASYDEFGEAFHRILCLLREI
jgi:hypothetical protein